MQQPISIFESLEDSVTIVVEKHVLIESPSYNIAIIPNTGAWSIIELKDIDKLQYLSTPKTIAEIKKDWKNYNGIESFINNLFFCRLILLNGKLARNNEQQTYPSISHFWVLKYTNACNLRCSYCYSYDKRNTKKNDMPNSFIYKISDLLDVKEKIELCFHGGEPLIRYQDIVECVRELRKKRGDSVSFIIQTNATLLTPAIATFLKKEDFSVGISIDGYNENTNKLRLFGNRRSSVHSTINAIKICKEAGFTPAILSVMTLNNCDYAAESIEFFAKMGIKSFHFIHFIPSGRAEKKEKLFSVPTEKLLSIRTEMLCFINDWNKDKPVSEHIHERYTRNIIRSLVDCRKTDYMCGQSPCGAGRRILAMTPAGNIFPCDDFCNNDNFKIGNINDINNLEDVVKKSSAIKLCQTHSIENTEECRNCIWKRICVSHCCSDSYNYSGRFNSPHSACGFIKQFIPTIIDLLYKGRIQIDNLIN